MAQEVRSILFTDEEVHAAVTHLLMQRIRGLSPDHVSRVEIELRDGIVQSTVRLTKEPGTTCVLDSNELMSAVLMHCRRSRIPLASRAVKRLGVIDGCLSLTTAINLTRIAPWVGGNTVVHAVAEPALLEQHPG